MEFITIDLQTKHRSVQLHFGTSASLKKKNKKKKTCMTQLTLSLNIRKYVLTFRLKRPDT